MTSTTGEVRHALHSSALAWRAAARATRRSMCDRPPTSRWWTVSIHGDDGVVLTPASPRSALAWQRLVGQSSTRPPVEGLGASPLGGAARDADDWARRCLDLRAAARHGRAYCYLVEIDGDLAGEALGFVDPDTSAVDVVVWLAPRHQDPARQARCVDLLARHALGAFAAVEYAVCYVRSDDQPLLSALRALRYFDEGELRDPPRPNRVVMVASALDPDRKAAR